MQKRRTYRDKAYQWWPEAEAENGAHLYMGMGQSYWDDENVLKLISVMLVQLGKFAKIQMGGFMICKLHLSAVT